VSTPEDPEGVFIICVPWYWPHIPESIARRCEECSIGIWVAPSSLALLADYPDAAFICHDCGVARIDTAVDAGDEVEFKIAPGAREEWAADMRRQGFEQG
jgi:hypothetical protein